MSQNKLQTLKGFRDFLPAEARKRQYVQAKIQEVFEIYGFEPLQSPTLEYASLLLGKYGKEADKLVYTFTDRGQRQVGLRYDQTVPTARILSQYQAQLPKYFRRYQIQNVFRADKPQKGRYREFTQCDCDIFGGNSILADAELLATVAAVFKNLGFKSSQIEFNDRSLLIKTLSPFSTKEVDVFSIIQSIDKLDKKTNEKVVAELVAKGLTQASAKAVLSSILKVEISDNLKNIEQKTLELGVPQSSLVFNPKLARGLDYYTGLIFEVKIPEYGNSSVGGGGRYDKLIEDLAGYNVPAVGIGLGFDRIVEICDQLGLIANDNMGTTVMVSAFSEVPCQRQAMQISKILREAKIKTEFLPTTDKLAKQLKVAEQKQIPFVVIVGENELQQNKFILKNMKSGEQKNLDLEEIVQQLQAFSPSLS
jgi:histidyl-tRNA synthetase